MPLSSLANAITTFYFEFTLFGTKNNIYHKLGLSQGFCGVGKNQWRVTAYETTREKDKTFGDALFADKRPLSETDSKLSGCTDRCEKDKTFGDALFADKRPLSNPNKSNPTTKKQTNRPKRWR